MTRSPGAHDAHGSGQADAPGSSPDTRRSGFGQSVLEVLPAWIVARVLVAISLFVAHLTVASVRPGNATARLHVAQGLLTWDGGWYESIARHGYAASGIESVRFFPAYPMAGRILGLVPGVGAGPALVIIANVASLLAMAVLAMDVRDDLGHLGDRGLARRSVWLLALAPSAYVLVLGYADALLLLGAVGALSAARRGRWWWAAAAGLLAGATRPLGVLVVVPVLIEAVRSRRAPDRFGPVARVAAVVAPMAGAGAYLGWVGAQFGDPLLPFRVQQQGGHRGPLTAPLSAMWHNATSVLHGHHLGSAAHIPWVLLCVVLVVVAFRRLPVSYGAFAIAVLVVSLTTSNLDSFERYALGAFPLVIAASTLLRRRLPTVLVLVASAGLMTAYAYLAFVGMVVP